MNKFTRRSAAMCLAIAVTGSKLVAQDTAIQPNELPTPPEVKRVIVTGSNIPTTQTAAEVGPNPVLVIDRYTIEKSGERNTEELLRNLPVANANSVPPSGNAGALYGQGASSISLRGFDPGATLVLLNGHRLAYQPSGTSGGTQFFVDLNSIPKASIESVEILKDGASSIYGADAVAGVVNIKLRQDYRGAEANIEYGNSADTDSADVSASIVFGAHSGETSFTGLVNYYRRNSIFSRDRAYDIETPLIRASTNGSPWNLVVSRRAAEAAAGHPLPSVDQNGNQLGDEFFAYAPFFSPGNASASSYTYTANPDVFFPINRYQGELPDTERYGAYLNAEHKIFEEQMVGYADLFFQRADIHNEQAPTNTNSFQLEGATTLAIPPHAPGATLGGPTYAETGVPPGAYNPLNPFQQIISGNSRARLFEFGNRQFDNRTDSFFTTIGLRGDKLFNGTWGYDAAFRYSLLDSPFEFNSVSTTRLNRLLNAADPIFDPSSSQYIGTTVPFNPFGDYRVPISNNYRIVDYAMVRAREIDTSCLAVVDLNIYTTELFRLPAGGVAFAFGAEFQAEAEKGTPNAEMRSGDLHPYGKLFAIEGSRNAYAGYAETSIPMFNDNFAVPGFHALELNVAVRYESFSGGSNVMAPKFGLRWQPIDDSLTVRATWGEGYRLPTLVELLAPPANSFQNVDDPVSGKTFIDVPSRFLPNPDLQPEDSRNFTAGIVYSPKLLPGLTLTIDFFNIETTGWVNPMPDPTRTVARIESGNVFPGEFVTRDANGNITFISQAAFENTGTQKARGFDFDLTFEWPTSIGTFRSVTQATYLDSFQFSPFPGAPEMELRSSPVDIGGGSDDAYLKWKGVSRLEWLWHDFDAIVTAHYYDGFHEFDAFGKEHWVRQTWLFDLQASYEFGHDRPATTHSLHFGNGWPNWRTLLDHVNLTVGINNIFDHDPPHSNDNFPRFIYDTSGRFVYVSVTKIF
jgi:iron complex outermembrane recepter protein